MLRTQKGKKKLDEAFCQTAIVCRTSQIVPDVDTFLPMDLSDLPLPTMIQLHYDRST